MINVSTSSKKPAIGILEKPLSYNEIVAFLEQLPVREYTAAAVERTARLNELFGNVAAALPTILVGGSNGKSLSMHFASKLLAEEGIKSYQLYSSHFLTYNERFVAGSDQIGTKEFCVLFTHIIHEVRAAGVTPTQAELTLIAGLLHAKKSNVTVVIVEVGLGGQFDPSAICQPVITAVTRVADDISRRLGSDLDEVAHELVSVARSGAWFVSAEQSKIRLQKMKNWVEKRGGAWVMPIRKLAQLPYMYEQLYGRTASLGERIAQLYVEEVQGRFSPFLRGNLLATKQGQRGRPTLEAKRNAELNPIKTMKTFWQEQFDLLRGRFELVKEKPVMLLDNASNIDAFMNLFLGVRLYHYQNPLKGFVLILGASKALHDGELVKAIRYLLKKVPGEVFFVPLPGTTDCCNPDQLLALAKDLNVKARAFDDFNHALKVAHAAVDEREGLVTITGSERLVAAYWQQRDMKRL